MNPTPNHHITNLNHLIMTLKSTRQQMSASESNRRKSTESLYHNLQLRPQTGNTTNKSKSQNKCIQFSSLVFFSRIKFSITHKTPQKKNLHKKKHFSIRGGVNRKVLSLSPPNTINYAENIYKIFTAFCLPLGNTFFSPAALTKSKNP